jgi:hypothetical protein
LCDTQHLRRESLAKISQQGSHFMRCGVEGLGSELQRRGISRHAQWGAQGIVFVGLLRSPHPLNVLFSKHLSSVTGYRSPSPLKRPLFTSEIAVQTESTSDLESPGQSYPVKTDSAEDQESTLRASDLASILKWSKEISSDTNLPSGKAAP